jgi:2-polyprenyl-3-methyl-5-hydroxy-6-metoxy-1,4-benzoquinol methylase
MAGSRRKLQPLAYPLVSGPPADPTPVDSLLAERTTIHIVAFHEVRLRLSAARKSGAARGATWSSDGMDLPLPFVIRESTHRIHDPLTPAELAGLGEALLLRSGQQILDLACGSGEMLCTWARDHGISGVGVDVSSAFIDAARWRADEVGVARRVRFEHGNARGQR